MSSAGHTWQVTHARGDMAERLSGRSPVDEFEAYVAGLVGADGSLVIERGRAMAIDLSQSVQARPVMEAIAAHYGRRLGEKRSITNCGVKHQLRMQLRNIPLCWKGPISVPVELIRHYLRGLVDGDGCIVKVGGHTRTEFYFLRGQGLGSIYLRYTTELGFPPRPSNTASPFVGSWKIYKKEFARLLYEDSTIALPIKKVKALF